MNDSKYRIQKSLKSKKGDFSYYSLKALQEQGYAVEKLPYSIRILLENALRNYDGFSITEKHIEDILSWQPEPAHVDIPYKPARVLMQDFTGVPAVVDIASLRSEVARKNKDANMINPQVPVDLIIDHSVQVDYFGTNYALQQNVEKEYERNQERYSLLKWGQQAFKNFKVLAPGLGICHQVNLEYLASVATDREGYVFPDTLVGTDSHTPMVNGIGVVGWGVGGIEAEAAMLGQPIFFMMPEVIGLRLKGELPKETTATDLVLTITKLLRSQGVVGKFVELFGEGLDSLSVPDRATISNMSPEFGCTVTYFPVDDQTLRYMRLSSRSEAQIDLVEQYAKANMLWRDSKAEPSYTRVVEMDLSTVVPSISGPKRPQDRISVTEAKPQLKTILKDTFGKDYTPIEERHENNTQGLKSVRMEQDGTEYLLSDASVVIAAITSCTNTSNPSVMIGAGLIAKKAIESGLMTRPWVKTSLAPGSKVVTDYLEDSGLMPYLEALRFHTVGFGCTSCIGNSGDLPEKIAAAVTENELTVAAVLSGNRNFEARVHPDVKMNFLASPMLVVIYALAGRADIDLYNEALGHDPNGKAIYMKDLWPSPEEIQDVVRQVIKPEFFETNYRDLFAGDKTWKDLEAPTGNIYEWDAKSTYIKEAPFFQNLPEKPTEPQDIKGARPLLMLGDSVTTDHISPAGKFGKSMPAGKYLVEHGVAPEDFNSYGSRRGNHEVMMRGTFANVRIKNELAGREGGFTRHKPSDEEMPVFDAAMKYQKEQVPLIVLGGKEYGSGSSRDWAAKGTNLLGVKAVLAESFERIHRSNLVGMGVLPLQMQEGDNRQSLGLTGDETYTITGISDGLKPGQSLQVEAQKPDGQTISFAVSSRLDSEIEIAYYKNGGILHYVLRDYLNK